MPDHLRDLATSCHALGIELVVVGVADRAVTHTVEQLSPAVRAVAAPGSATAAELRRIGLASTDADIIAFVDTTPAGAIRRLEALVLATRGGGDTPNPKAEPFLSVTVPAHGCAETLPRCLRALRASDLAPAQWELVVVDDASTDETELVAAEYADTVVRLAGNPYGPAYARNRGADVSRGTALVFVDSDVVVHPDALSRCAERLSTDSEVSAVFGCYDMAPEAPGLLSKYRNLLHHYVHQANAGPAETFWAGLGAVRRGVFQAVGGFDEWHYSRPQIEDIELGRRLRRAGRTIVLDPSIQGTHLKRWTLGRMLATDFKSRGVPWMWLLLHEGPSPGSAALNLRRTQRWCVVLAGLVILAAVASLKYGWLALGVAGVAGIAILMLNHQFYMFLRKRLGLLSTLACIPLHFAYFVVALLSSGSGWIMQVFLGEPAPSPEREAFAQVGFKTWPPPLAQRSTMWRAPTPRDPDAPVRRSAVSNPE